MEFDCLQPATKQGSEYLTYVLWAITPEGRTANLGEILLNRTTRAAVEKGIVPGGGVALLRASVALQALRLEGDEQFGVTIVHRACEEPVRQIVVNCGTEGAIVVEKIKTSEDPNPWL